MAKRAQASREQLRSRKQLTTRKHYRTLPRMSISEGVRTAIDRSGVSRYVLARVAKVDEAALSRFAAGKSGLSSESLDRFAEALGLELIFTVARTPRPTSRGRRRMEASVETEVELDWQALARDYARDVHKNHFESRRGVWLLPEDDTKAVVHNNNPYTAWTIRPVETERLRGAMKADGFTEMAYAEYGEDADMPWYTYAMIVDLGRGRRASRFQRLVDVYRDVTFTTIQVAAIANQPM